RRVAHRREGAPGAGAAVGSRCGIRGCSTGRREAMTVTVDVAAEHIARRIASTIDPVFAMIDGWRDVLERELSGPLAGALTGTTQPIAHTLPPVVPAPG